MPRKRPKKVALIGVPLDLGASKKGTSGGPEGVRRTPLVAGLEELGLAVEDRGDVEVPERDQAAVGSRRKKYHRAITQVCRSLMGAVRSALKDGCFPVVLGGDHSLAVGSISGAAAHYRERGEKIGLIWVDAHGDMNTPSSSPSGNVHGMPVAHVLGLGDRVLAKLGGFEGKVEPRNICLLGLRDLDAREKDEIRKAGVNVFTMKHIDIRGMARVMSQALELASTGTAGIHLSFDIDAVDPSIAQGTGTPSRGGLTYREAHLLMELAADSGRLVSLDMVEINPLEDVKNNTAHLASELIQSALGKTIY